MMCLYELTNGYIGESYVRCYVWCAEGIDPIPIAKEKMAYCELHRWKAKLLLTSQTEAFSTSVSDSGWEIV